jgi:hypothetical protein
MRHHAAIAVASMLALSVQAAYPAIAAGPQVGAVSRIQASGEALRDGGIHPLGSGSAVHQGDELRTGKGARLEVRLLDDTTLTLGESARVLIDDFVFDPGRGVGAVAVDALTGSFRFVTGRLSTMADRRVAVTTAFATIGIRGTDVWAGPIRGVYGVLLLDGTIDVTAAGTTRSLDTAGSGVDIAAPGAPPGPVVQWAAEKTAEALSSVAFTQ